MPETEMTGLTRLTKMLEKLTKNDGFDGPLTDELRYIKLPEIPEDTKEEGKDVSQVSNEIFNKIFNGEVKNEKGLLTGCLTWFGCEKNRLNGILTKEGESEKDEKILSLLVNSVKTSSSPTITDDQVKKEIKKKLNEYFEKTYNKYNVYKPDFWKAVKIAKVTDGAIIDAVKNTFTVPGQSDEQSEKLKENLINVLESSGGIGSGINEIIDMVTNGNASFLPTKSEGTAPSPHTAPDYYGLFASLWKEDGVMHDLKQMTKVGVDNVKHVFPNAGDEGAVSPEQSEEEEDRQSEQPEAEPEPSENCYSELKTANAKIQQLENHVNALEKRAKQAENLSKDKTSSSLFDRGVETIAEMMSSNPVKRIPTEGDDEEEEGDDEEEEEGDDEEEEEAKKIIFGGLTWKEGMKLYITNVSKSGGIADQYNPFYCAQGSNRIPLRPNTITSKGSPDEWSGTCEKLSWSEAKVPGGRNKVDIVLKSDNIGESKATPKSDNVGKFKGKVIPENRVGTIVLNRTGSKAIDGTIILDDISNKQEMRYNVHKGTGHNLSTVWFTMTLIAEFPETSRLAKSLGKLKDSDLMITSLPGHKIYTPVTLSKIKFSEPEKVETELVGWMRFSPGPANDIKNALSQNKTIIYKWEGTLGEFNKKRIAIVSGSARAETMAGIYIEEDTGIKSGEIKKNNDMFYIKWNGKTGKVKIELEMTDHEEQKGGKRRRSIAKRNKSKKYTKKRRNVRSGHKRSRGKRSRGKRSRGKRSRGHKRTKHNRPKHTKRAKHTRRK